MCAMACPFAVVRYYQYILNREAAHKCDQCTARQKEGKVPACVEACKVGALLFDEVNTMMDKDTEKLASLIYLGIREQAQQPGTFSSLVAYKQKLNEIRRRQS